MGDPHQQGPECDFCGLRVDEGEELEPLFVGGQPKPEPHVLRQTSLRGGISGNRYKSKYDALRKALYDCPDVNVNESNVVHEVKDMGGDKHFVTEQEIVEADRNPIRFESKRTQRIGVTLTIEPKDVDADPDAMVCDICSDMFKSL